MQDQLLKLLSARQGHFLFESGHHGDLWLDLESLFFRPQLVRPQAAALAAQLRGYDIEIVCGPLVEGSFVGLLVALELGVEFVYSERFFRPTQDGLFPAGYRIPEPLRKPIRKKRIAIVNDVINAGSAVRGTFDDLLNLRREYRGDWVAAGSGNICIRVFLQQERSSGAPRDSPEQSMDANGMSVVRRRRSIGRCCGIQLRSLASAP